METLVERAGASPLIDSASIKLAIVGCGRIAEQCHIPAALSASHVELVAVVDDNPDRLDHVVGALGLSCLATTSRAALAERVDAVVLPLPNHLHYPIASEFLNAGVHVLCEKPLATTTREARLLCELAESRSLVLAVGYTKRFEPNFELMKRLIDEAFLGRLDGFEFEYGSAGGWAPVSSYNLRREGAGGGVLMTNGCHLLDRMVCWFGKPSSVTFSDDWHGGVEANCSAVFGFESGLTGEVRLSKTLPLRNRFRLYGERGCIEIENAQHGSVTFFPARQRGVKHQITEHPAREALSDIEYFRLQIEDFAHAIHTGTQPRVSGREGLASVELIEQCYRVRTPLPESWAIASLPKRNDAPARSRDGSGDSRNPAVSARPSGIGPGRAHTPSEAAVLITGATGFVGSRLYEVLYVGTDYQPRAFVHSSGKGSYIARYPLACTVGDLTDLASVRKAIEGCSYVVHLARGADRVMTKGLENVLRAAVDARVSRFVHVSSVAVYGDNPPPSARSETAPARKTGNPYGDIKLEQEWLVASYGSRYGLPFVILRPPHILGPYSHFVDALNRRLQAGELPIVDGGASVCNLVYIDNLIEAICLSLERDEAVGETFFITDKERVTWRECLEEFGAMLGVEVPHATSDQLHPPARPGMKDSVLRLSRIVLSEECRSAAMGIPGLGAVGRSLSSGYTRVPEKYRNYIRSRVSGPSSPLRAQPANASRYDATDYLIVSQRRKVVHACDKAERVLGYTAPVGYHKAMALTREWLAFAGLIQTSPDRNPELEAGEWERRSPTLTLS